MKIVSLEQLSFESFAALEKTFFCVCLTEQEPLDLELSEVSPLRVAMSGGINNQKFENFTLTFVGPANRPLSQQTYWFESAAQGRFELFIVPVGRDSSGVRYEATLNRLAK